jgi:hypothetical protein
MFGYAEHSPYPTRITWPAAHAHRGVPAHSSGFCGFFGYAEKPQNPPQRGVCGNQIPARTRTESGSTRFTRCTHHVCRRKSAHCCVPKLCSGVSGFSTSSKNQTPHQNGERAGTWFPHTPTGAPHEPSRVIPNTFQIRDCATAAHYTHAPAVQARSLAVWCIVAA